MARVFAAGGTEPAERELAQRAAEAQLEIVRMRRLKVDLINHAAVTNPRMTIHSGSMQERATAAFAQKSKTLAAFDRYERRALARRNRALRELLLVRVARLREPPEPVGPPQAKDTVRSNPFVQDLMRLELRTILERRLADPSQVPLRPLRDFLPLQWGSAQEPVLSVSAVVEINGHAGLLTLRFTVQGQEVKQDFAIAGTRMRVGGVRWHFKCPDTAKLVRELYFVESERAFRSRHALKLTYESQRRAAADRYLVRARKLMRRIGATDFILMPPRPKYMRRRTYDRICAEIEEAGLRMRLAALGRSAADFGID